VSRVTSQWEAPPRHRGGRGWRVVLPVTVAAAALVTSPLAGEGVPCIALMLYRSSGSACYVTAGVGGGRLHSANTSQYYITLEFFSNNLCVISVPTEYQAFPVFTNRCRAEQKLTADNQPARSLLASGPAGTHGHIFFFSLDLCLFSLFIGPP
jgi:hypothetical protein